MKKGLRLKEAKFSALSGDFNRRPDEEGIKTSRPVPAESRTCISTADLMKKGLRPHPEEPIPRPCCGFQPQT